MKKYNRQFKYDRKSVIIDKHLNVAMNLTDHKLEISDLIKKRLFRKNSAKAKSMGL
jgi:hypothetical protein